MYAENKIDSNPHIFNPEELTSKPALKFRSTAKRQGVGVHECEDIIVDKHQFIH